MFTRRRVVALFCTLLLIEATGCSQPRPVLYPNPQYEKVGTAQANRDIDECLQRAEQFVSSDGAATQTARDVGTSTAVGAATGAAIGAVGGAVSGDPGTGAAVGAATGSTAGLLGGLFHSGSRGPDPVFAAFVDRCLRERGYDPIGWD